MVGRGTNFAARFLKGKIMTPEKFVKEPHRLWTEPKRQTAREFFRAEGFTIIEMIIVVAILGIVCAIAIPSFQRYAVNGNLRSAARDMMSDFNALKGRAMAESREYRLIVNGNQYTIDACAMGAGPDGLCGTADDTPMTSPCCVWGAPPAGVVATKNPASFSSDIVMSPNFTYIFQTRGVVTPTPPGGIVFTNNRLSTATVIVNATGRVSAQFNMR
jgi:prepilin-type N-terminal cleavage/methylation domain-containing protein